MPCLTICTSKCFDNALYHAMCQEPGQIGDQPLAIDTGDLIVTAADQHPLAIQFLLGQPLRVENQALGFGFTDGIAQLRQDAGGPVGLVRAAPSGAAVV